MTGAPLTAAALLTAAVATVAIGTYGVRLSRTTSDFLVASRTIGPRWNAAAISGEYLSAASFLGVAGLIAKYGADALWYPVGFTAGYLGLLLFVAAPLRRSGAYTVPGLTTMAQPFARLGRASVDRLVARISGADLPPGPELSLSLVVRGSCGCPPQPVSDRHLGTVVHHHNPEESS